MTNEKIMTLQFRFTKTRVLAALTLLLLCWHPRVLDSETLTMTTYYPAPYGGYVSILTTGNTYLSRDTGNLIVGAMPAPAPTEKLYVSGNARAQGQVYWGGGKGTLAADQGASIELGGAGTPYVDFSQNPAQDFSARLWLAAAGQLQVVGDLSVTGDIRAGASSWIRNFCSAVTYGGGTVRCPGSRIIIGHYPTGSCVSGGQLFLGGDYTNPGRWVAHTEECRGVMVCCSIEQ